MRFTRVGLALLAGCSMFTATAGAADQGTSEGFMIRVNMPVTSVSSLINSAAGVPQFAIGLRRGHMAYGLGLGLSRAGVTTESSSPGYNNKDEMNGLLFQVAPTLWIDFWQAPDGQTTGNVIAAFQYGRISAKTKNTYSSPFGSGSFEDKVTGNLFGFVVGVGADHQLAAHFSLGVEAGAQGVFGTDIKPENSGTGGGGSGTKSGFSTAILYGATRATVTF